MGGIETELGVVTEALGAGDAEAQRLAGSASKLRGQLEAREQEAADLREELARARTSVADELRSLALLSRQVEELRVSARGQATRIRLRALREAAEVSARLPEGDEAQGAGRERILDALEEAIDRVAGEWEPGTDASRAATVPVRASGRAAQVNGGRRRRVSVDVGPFADFSQLVRFEDAANAIGATGDISIKRFSEGRARIDVALSEPVDLLRELEERCDLEFKVRSRGDDEIILDVDG